MALPLFSPERLKEILILDESASVRSSEQIFKDLGEFRASLKERELYKRFRGQRKPLLLWFQRAYVYETFKKEEIKLMFKGITDEEAVPYDFDHLCPQNHWDTDWRNIKSHSNISSDVLESFGKGRSDIGHCIGNLHVLESSLNRSCGDEPLEIKLSHLTKDWSPDDSLLYLWPESQVLWKLASPSVESEANKNKHWEWGEDRLKSFQSVVEGRAFSLYEYFYNKLKFSIWTNK